MLFIEANGLKGFVGLLRIIPVCARILSKAEASELLETTAAVPSAVSTLSASREGHCRVIM